MRECVRALARALGRMCSVRGIQYYDYIIIIILGFNGYIFVDLVNRGVLTIVSEIRRF